MLTAPLWFKQLPDPIQKKALKSLKHAKNTRLFPSLEIAIGQAFVWGDTRDGFKFWEKVYTDLKEGKIKLKEETIK